MSIREKLLCLMQTAMVFVGMILILEISFRVGWYELNRQESALSAFHDWAGVWGRNFLK